MNNLWALIQLTFPVLAGLVGVGLGAWLQHNTSAKVALNDARRVVYAKYIKVAFDLVDYNVERQDNSLPIENGHDDSMHDALGTVFVDLQLLASKPVLTRVTSCTRSLHTAIDNGGLLECSGEVDEVLKTMRADISADKL